MRMPLGLLPLLAVTVLFPATSFAGSITYIDVDLGFWESGTNTFTLNEARWNTNNGANWALGITNGGATSLLNHAVGEVPTLLLQDAVYDFYMAAFDSVNDAIQITVGYDDGSQKVGVFSAPNGTLHGGGGTPIAVPYVYSFLAGDDMKVSLVQAPDTVPNLQLVGQTQKYEADGTPNWVIRADTTVPEPASWLSFALGIGGIFVGRLRRRV